MSTDPRDVIIIRRNQISTRGLTVAEIERLREISGKGDSLTLADRAYYAAILFRQSGRP